MLHGISARASDCWRERSPDGNAEITSAPTQSERDDADRRRDSEPARDSMNVATTSARRGLGRSSVRQPLTSIGYRCRGAERQSPRALNGKAYEALSAAFERRRLTSTMPDFEVRLGDGSFVIEVAPSPDAACRPGRRRRRPCWQPLRRCPTALPLRGPLLVGRSDPDVDEAVASPCACLMIQRPLIACSSSYPPSRHSVWGRDELQTGDMWNSNSVISWLIARAHLLVDVALPPHGRAPGWAAGIRVAYSESLLLYFFLYAG